MGSITSIKCVLTQEHLDAICAKYFVPEEVHPQLPSSDATMHERPAGKVGMYTRFFDYANYRIPFSTFFVSVLTHFRIPFTQLSVFGSAKFRSTIRRPEEQVLRCSETRVLWRPLASSDLLVCTLTLTEHPVVSHCAIADLSITNTSGGRELEHMGAIPNTAEGGVYFGEENTTGARKIEPDAGDDETYEREESEGGRNC
ncbi:hypothetical protein Tco_0981259 [Tanacetum coccineum]